MAHIFISYRRNDTPAAAGRIYDALVAAFGKDKVFKDVDAIGAGEDFEEVIRTKLRQTSVVVSVIGRQWEGRRGFFRKPRIFDNDDWVRIELELARNLRLPVIPILIDRTAPLSSGSLPSALQYLSKLQSPQLRHDRWSDDLAAVIRDIQTSYGEDLGLKDTKSPLSLDDNRTGRSATAADIYVCFRQSDVPDLARRVFLELQRQFADATIRTSNDVANIAMDEQELLHGQITEKTIVVVLIGKNWLSAESATGERRLHQSGDYVRVAIETAFRNRARVIPIMLDGASFPRPDELPRSIAPLTRRNALELPTETVRFDESMRRITETIRLSRVKITN